MHGSLLIIQASDDCAGWSLFGELRMATSNSNPSRGHPPHHHPDDEPGRQEVQRRSVGNYAGESAGSDACVVGSDGYAGV